MAADRPCGEFYDFYSDSPEYFGYALVIPNTLTLHHQTESLGINELYILNISIGVKYFMIPL
jgi:hypothetical protein